MEERIRIAVVQHGCKESRQDNLHRSLAGLEQASARGAQLALLPELSTLPYFCTAQRADRFDLAEPIPGPTSERLSQAAQRLKLAVAATIFERRQEGLYHNTAIVLEPDGNIAGLYRKMHIPEEPGYHEKYYFAPGDGGFCPLTTSLGRIGVMVCWDQWFPEAARLMALAGAEFLLYPSAIGWDPADDRTERQRQLDAWITVQRGHAIANSLPVVASNRIGRATSEKSAAEICFWGSSFVAGPQGEMLAQAPTSRETVIVADIEPKRTATLRRIWPFLRDRRTDAYAGLLTSGPHQEPPKS